MPARGRAAWVRSAWRGVLVAAVLFAMVVDARWQLWRGTMRRGAEGAVWMHGWCRRLLRCMGVSLSVTGRPTEWGAVVCNHLSYLDILVLSAATPAVMVAKTEVRGWPLFGWLTGLAGTVYVRRGGGPAEHAGVNGAMARAYAMALPVIFFPEGTTTDGSDVLPFRRGLFHSVLKQDVPLQTAAVGYTIEGDASGSTEARHVCWWGDATLLPHLCRLLGLRRVQATLAFGDVVTARTDRFVLAETARGAVAELRETAGTRKEWVREGQTGAVAHTDDEQLSAQEQMWLGCRGDHAGPFSETSAEPAR